MLCACVGFIACWGKGCGRVDMGLEAQIYQREIEGLALIGWKWLKWHDGKRGLRERRIPRLINQDHGMK